MNALLKLLADSRFFSFKFWDAALVKIVESLISVKVWGLIAITVLSSMFLVKGYLDGGNWVAINGTIYGIIYGMREIFKISRIKVFDEAVKKSNASTWQEVNEKAAEKGMMR